MDVTQICCGANAVSGVVGSWNCAAALIRKERSRRHGGGGRRHCLGGGQEVRSRRKEPSRRHLGGWLAKTWRVGVCVDMGDFGAGTVSEAGQELGLRRCAYTQCALATTWRWEVHDDTECGTDYPVVSLRMG
jgi:hypothetical protein